MKVVISDRLREIRDREIAQGQAARFIKEGDDGPVQVECTPGYSIVATRVRNGSTAILYPDWPYDAASGVALAERRLAPCLADRYRDFRAESKIAAR